LGNNYEKEPCFIRHFRRDDFCIDDKCRKFNDGQWWNKIVAFCTSQGGLLMRIPSAAILLGTIVLCSIPSPVQAQTPESQIRCQLLGPLVIRGYIDLLSQASQQKRDLIGSSASQASNLIELYDKLGCGTKELIAAVECLSVAMLEKNTVVPIGFRAQKCMRSAGMPVR
jgi:hypothetical protein